MNNEDIKYAGLPWKRAGTTRAGVDCRGLAMLWAHEQLGLELPAMQSVALNGNLEIDSIDQAQLGLLLRDSRQEPAGRGDVLFLRHKATGLVSHVAIYLGDNRYLHITRACASRIENGLTLMRRLGFEPVGYLGPGESQKLVQALSEKSLTGPEVWVPIVLAVLSIAASAASAFLMPKPKLGKQSNQNGLYGFDQLFTESNPKLPLPDLLGAVTVAGNSPYQSLVDKTQQVGDASAQKANKVVILGSGTINSVTNNGAVMKINGRPYTDTYWHPSGMALNPIQDRANAVDGTIGADAARPSVTVYTGAPGISVPVDVRAYYDRNFPPYGFNGAAYAVFRLIDSTKFTSFNLNATIQGRLCRQFNAAGFVTASISETPSGTPHSWSGQAVSADVSTNEFNLSAHGISPGEPVVFSASTSMPGGINPGQTYYALAGANGNYFKVASAPGGTAIDIVTTPGSGVTVTARKTRFKLSHEDIADDLPLTVTVDGIPYAEMGADNQSGNVYRLNKVKGFIEFVTAPAAGAAISVSYSYFPRAWTQNPASHIVYLLTEPIRGKGFPASKIDFVAATALWTHCNTAVSWAGASRSVFEPRYQCNYSIDVYKPIQEHIRAVLDACYSYLFVSNGKFVMRPRKAENSVFSFNPTNILVEGENSSSRSTFSSELQDRAQKANRITAFYHSKETYNAETGIVRDDENDQALRSDWAGNLGIVDETLRLLAVDSETQAERLAETILRENVNSVWLCELKTNIKGLPLEPGDVVDITHPSQPTWAAKLFRIEDISYDSQDHLTLKLSEYFGPAYI